MSSGHRPDPRQAGSVRSGKDLDQITRDSLAVPNQFRNFSNGVIQERIGYAMEGGELRPNTGNRAKALPGRR